MRKSPLICLVFIAIIAACQKKDYNVGIDYTVGINDSTRHWKGTTWGYCEDTTMINDTDYVKTAEPYNRVITDSAFAVFKYNTHAVKAFDALLRYREIDSTAGTTKYDTLFSGTNEKTILVRYFTKDSMHFEYHKVKDFNSYSGKHIEEHWQLDTKSL